MGNILGNPFADWVTTQINVRQKALGKNTNISSDTLKYYSNKTPWIRLASAIDLDTGNDESNMYQKLVSNGVPGDLIGGSNLAKNFILQGGSISSNDSGSLGLNYGLNSNNKLFEGAYGWGGIEERGYVPLPGVTKADIQYYNNGAFTKTTINVRCYSKTQFQLLDVLYLRPGYTLLLEFGWSMYLDDKGNLQSFNNFYTDPLSHLLDPGENDDQYQLYRLINNERTKHFGNYEAICGVVHGFNWQFNKDGSYDCQIQMTGVGDVIEALKVNISLLNQIKYNDTPLPLVSNKVDNPFVLQKDPSEKSSNPLVANANKTLLNKKLFEIYQSSQTAADITYYPYKIYDYPDPDNNYNLGILDINNAILSVPGTTSDLVENQSPQVYITFGTLMAIIQSRLLLYNPKNDKTKVPIATFDIDFPNLEKDENYIFKFPGQFSSNPNICLIPYQNLPPLKKGNVNSAKSFTGYGGKGGGVVVPNSELNQKLLLGAKWIVEDAQYLGRLSNLYVNINYIVETLENCPSGEDGSISLLQFLQSLTQGITYSLGGVNQIEIHTSPDGYIRFTENIPQRFDNGEPGGGEKGTYAKFNIFGVKAGNEGSFIRDISLTTEISKDFTKLIAIGAQSDGNQLSTNATSFSNYNKGLKDRIIEKKVISYSRPDEDKTEEKVVEEYFWRYINGNTNLFNQIYNGLNFTSENINALSSHNVEYAGLVSGELTNKKQIQAPFFLPFNLSLEMDGLSGMVLYQKFLMTDDILPPSYEKDGVDLQIKGINHFISPEAWITKIDTQSIPSSKLSNVIRPQPLRMESSPLETSIDNCGPPVLLPTPPSSPGSTKRTKAITNAFNTIFRKYGEKNGMCSRWVYNLASAYVSSLKTDSYTPGEQIAAGGNANQNHQYYNNLVKLGYKKSHIGRSISKSQLINIINNTEWGDGDIIAYYANDGRGSHRTYGHTQIYVGGLIPTKWSTSIKNNYGTSFVYGGRTSKCWDLIIFRAPIN